MLTFTTCDFNLSINTLKDLNRSPISILIFLVIIIIIIIEYIDMLNFHFVRMVELLRCLIWIVRNIMLIHKAQICPLDIHFWMSGRLKIRFFCTSDIQLYIYYYFLLN